MKSLLQNVFLVFLMCCVAPVFSNAQKSGVKSKAEIELYLQRSMDVKPTNLDSAMYYANFVATWASQQNDFELHVKANTLIADIYYYKNEREKGFEYLIEALKLCEMHGLDFDKIDIYYSIGLHYSRSARRGDATIDENKLKQALAHHQQGIVLSEKLNLPIAASKGYNLSGVCYARLGEVENAKFAYQKSEDYSRAANDSIGLGYTLDYAGTLYAQIGELSKAESMLIEALEIRKLLQDTFAYAINLNNVGEFYMQSTNYDKAIPYLESSFAISSAKPYQDLALHTAGLLASIYEKLNRFDLAYALKQKEMVLMDTLYSINRAKSLIEMETKYETELKEKEIAQRDLQISKQQTQLIVTISLIVLLLLVVYFVYYRQKLKQIHLKTEMRLKEQLAAQELQDKIQTERLRLSRDLHDSLGAELTLITSEADGNAYESSNELAKSSYEKIAAMSRNAVGILRDTIWAIRKDSLDVDEFTAKLMNYIQQRQGNMQIAIEHTIADSILLTPSQSLHLFRVCQEAIHNAIKHAKATKLSIYFYATDTHLSLILEDNGVGFEEGESTGYGLSNMRERISEIEGSIHITSAKGHGTKVEIEIPREL